MAKKKMAPAQAHIPAQDLQPADNHPEDAGAQVDPERKPRSLSPYNRFMKINVTKLKQENPGLAHKEAFRQAALAWASAPENPKNTGTASAVAAAPATHHQQLHHHIPLAVPHLPSVLTTTTAETAPTHPVKKSKGSRKAGGKAAKATAAQAAAPAEPMVDAAAAAAT